MTYENPSRSSSLLHSSIHSKSLSPYHPLVSLGKVFITISLQMFSSFRRQSTTVIKVVSRNQTATSPVMIDVQRLEQLQAEQKKKRTVTYPSSFSSFHLSHHFCHRTGNSLPEQYSTEIPQGTLFPFSNHSFSSGHIL